jgi:hypothetical protein
VLREDKDPLAGEGPQKLGEPVSGVTRKRECSQADVLLPNDLGAVGLQPTVKDLGIGLSPGVRDMCEGKNCCPSGDQLRPGQGPS